VSNSKSEDAPNCDCLCHNPDALKWGCEHCAMLPQDRDSNSPEFRGIKTQVTSLDDRIKQFFLDNQITDSDAESFEDIEYYDTEQIVKDIAAWHKAEIAKLFEQIRSEAELYNVKSINGEIVKPNTGILAVPLEALTRLEGKQ